MLNSQKLWGVFCGILSENWPRYNGTALYMCNKAHGYASREFKLHMGRLNFISPQCRIYASMNWVSIGSGNGLASNRRQAITWTSVNLFSFEPLGTNFSENRIETLTFSFKCRLRNGGHFVQGWGDKLIHPVNVCEIILELTDTMGRKNINSINFTMLTQQQNLNIFVVTH